MLCILTALTHFSTIIIVVTNNIINAVIVNYVKQYELRF